MLRRAFELIICLVLLLPSVAWSIGLQVQITGVDKKLIENLQKDLHIYQAISEPKLTAERIQNLYELAPTQITETLQAKGYYGAEIKSNLLHNHGATADQDSWVAEFSITLGKPTTISKVYITITGHGKNDPRITKFLQTPDLAVGKILTHADYENTKERLLSDFNSIGYLQADFSQTVVEVDRKNHVANINLTLDTGKQYVFGELTFIDGLYPNFFLERFAPFKPGDPYELQKLIQFQSNLESADLYNKIRFDPIADLDDPNNIIVPIQVRLTPKPNNRYTGSVGYGTDTGIRGSLGWLHRFPTTAGHKLSANLYASQVRSTARLSYLIPGSHPATDKYIFGVLAQEEKFEEVYSRKAELFATKDFKRGKLATQYGLSLFTETFHVGTNVPNQNKNFLLPSAKWTWIDAHEKEYFEFGTKYDLSMRGGINGVLSDASVLQTEINLKHIFPVTKKMRFLLRSDFGFVASKRNEFDSLPPSLRFFTGGEETVRGYAYNSLGPRLVPSDPDSVTGGRYLLVVSGEVEHNIYDQINGVVFFDAGNTAYNLKIPLAFGTGVGVRYKTPIGSFKLDLAKPLNTVTNKHWRVHVNFGTDF